MAVVVRIFGLVWADTVASYAMYVMMSYLTNVWKLGFTHAAGILNVFWGVTSILPLFLVYIVETFMGNYWMLMLSSFAYSAGLGLLSMSTPPVLGQNMGTCREYKPECIGQEQRKLLYVALPLIAFGMSGHMTSWNSFRVQQMDVDDDDSMDSKFFYSVMVTIVFHFVAVFGFPYIKPWSLRFGIPAIYSLLATLLFASGSCSYYYFKPLGSSLTLFFRVFVAAASKMFYKIPRNPMELCELDHHPQFIFIPHTNTLRCLDKAAIIKPTMPLEEQVKNIWTICTVSEVEETKTLMRMIPVCTTFILCGVVAAIGFTYFVGQLDHLNHKVGHLNLPSVALLWLVSPSQSKLTNLYARLANRLGRSGSRRFAPPLGIAVSMIIAILCCITAAAVESRRLAVVRKHGLVDKPDETVPMSMFWLLPQFVLLGMFTGILNDSAVCFFVDQAPITTRVSYLPFLFSAVFGVGILASVLSVFVAGKMNWFHHDLNGSRLDKYYWTLAWMMAVNLEIFIVVAIFYRYKESEVQEQQGGEGDGIDEGFNDNSNCFC